MYLCVCVSVCVYVFVCMCVFLMSSRVVGRMSVIKCVTIDLLERVWILAYSVWRQLHLIHGKETLRGP